MSWLNEEEIEYLKGKTITHISLFTIAYRNSSNGYYGGSLNWNIEKLPMELLK